MGKFFKTFGSACVSAKSVSVKFAGNCLRAKVRLLFVCSPCQVTASVSTENCRFTVGHNVCITAGSFALAGGSPASGTYSGNGVSGGIFNPSAAGAGTHTVTYTYSDGNGCTDSASQTIYVDVCTDVMAQNNNVSFIIYPNPNIGIFTIETKEKEYELIITNVLGEQILSQKNQNEKSEIDLSKQPNGIYFLQIKTEQGIMNKKIILN